MDLTKFYEMSHENKTDSLEVTYLPSSEGCENTQCEENKNLSWTVYTEDGTEDKELESEEEKKEAEEEHNKILQLKLSFPYPNWISADPIPDVIQIKFRDPEKFIGLETK